MGKEELAGQIAERDGIEEGLICVVSALGALSARAVTPDRRTVRPINPVARQLRCSDA